MVTHHGVAEQRGMNDAAQTPSGRVWSYRFVNQFAQLEPYNRDNDFLEELGSATVEGDDIVGPMVDGSDNDRNADVPAGIAFFGQFIDHEITFDPTSDVQRRNDPRALRNFRTPALDLDSLYGSGEEVSPFLYDEHDPHEAKLLTAAAESVGPADRDRPRAARFGATDLQRNQQGVALITDARNDENVVLSQLMLAFVRFHNNVVDYVRSGAGYALLEGGEGILGTAERLVRWHYQWIVLHEFLPQVCDNSVLDDVLNNGRRHFLHPDDDVAIPVEFAGAAYRYGHSQIRDTYTVNADAEGVRFFPGPAVESAMAAAAVGDGGTESELSPPPETFGPDVEERSLEGFRPVPDDLVVDWRYFFDHGEDPDGVTHQFARPIDAALPPALFLLPFVDSGLKSLATRNLRRGKALGLPSGQSLAKAMGLEPLDNDELPLGDETLADHLRSVHRGADTEAPLWLYILAESDAQQDGHRLGALGSRIVAEVIVGMLSADKESYVNKESEWRPTLPRPISAPNDPTDEDRPYRLADLLHFATGPSPDGLRLEVDADGTGSAPETDESDPTNGEAVILEHGGEGPLSLSGYTVDFADGQRVRLVAGASPSDGEVGLPAPELFPGDRLVVYTGEGPTAAPENETPFVALGRQSAMINDAGDVVVVQTPDRTVSAYESYAP